MSGDDKLDFFLRHWTHIVEWAAPRDRAAATLDQALLNALEVMSLTDGTTHLDVQTGGTRIARLHISRATHDAWLEMQWQRNRLFDGVWPHLILVWNKNASTAQVRNALKQATARRCSDLGMVSAGSQRDWWVWHGTLTATDEPFDLEGYAQDCVERFQSAWTQLGDTIEQAVKHERSAG